MTSPRRATFKQIDITRAIRGARAGGAEQVRIELTPDGRMILETVPSTAPPKGFENEWDEVLQ